MTMKFRLTGSGVAPLAAIGVVGSITDTLTAAGSTQGTALAVVDDINVVTTAAASTGVILRADLSAGDSQTVVNLGASSLSVYPPVGGAIQSGSTNAAFAVASGKSATFVCRNSLSFVAVLSA